MKSLSMPARRTDALVIRLTGRLLVVGLSMGSASAQTANDYFQVVDRDGDGRLSLLEFQNWMSRAFHQMDRNHDAILAPDEQLVPNARTVTLTDLHHRLALQFARQDRNHDGWLTATEYLAPPQ